MLKPSSPDGISEVTLRFRVSAHQLAVPHRSHCGLFAWVSSSVLRVFSFSLRWVVLSAASMALLTAASAQAQSAPSWSTSTPTLQYRSALAQYRGFNDQPVTSWVEANDTVGKIGGWRVYAKEARQPEPAAGNAASTKPEPATGMPGSPMGHGGKP